MAMALRLLWTSGLLRALRLAGAVGVAGLLAACAAGGGPPTAIYDLSARATGFEGKGGRSSIQLLIPEPMALKAYNSDSIAVRPSPLAISYFQGVLWADRLPRMVQSKVLQSFENSRRVKAVGLPGEGLLINYQVLLEIRAFELRTDGQARAYIEMAAKILNDSNGGVIANKVFIAEVPVSSDQPAKAVAGLDAALKQVLDELVAWTIGAV